MMNRIEPASFSAFGQRYLGDSGVLRLMNDLGEVVGRDDLIMMGGGNPSRIPAVEEVFRERMGRMLGGSGEFEALIGNYDSPRGNQAFIESLVVLLRSTYGWPIGPENIALTNGSQPAFFFLFNLVAGRFADKREKKILLPLAPEYIGYEDAGLVDNLFVSYRPQIDFLDPPFYKYLVDFDQITITDEIGAICVSRPTNPTGNVLTEVELRALSDLAQQNEIYLILDNAYGAPFPYILYRDVEPWWEPHIIMCMSLSKLGLPGARTGIVIAHERVIQAVTGMNAVITLAPNSFGAMLALDLVRSGEILQLSQEVIRPHYWRKAQQAVAWLQEVLTDVEFYIHKPEGAFFLWLWLKGMPISCEELYRRLKARGVLILPGHFFFPGLAEEWNHRHACIRMNYAGTDETVHAGIRVLAEEVRRAYRN